MRNLWRGLARIVFWSFERGSWPYDVAVAVIVAFVLLSPRSWFEDRPVPPANAVAAAGGVPGVELRGSDPAAGSQIYRVDARLIPGTGGNPAALQQELHEAVRQNAKYLAYGTDFEIIRVIPIPGQDGAIAYYDVLVQPQE